MNSKTRPWAILIGLTAGLVIMAGCGGEALSESAEVSEQDADGSDSSGTQPPGDGGDKTGTTDECNAGTVDQGDACEMCVAESCAMEALACCKQPGCLDIVHCAQEKSCNGVSCYTPDACQDEIDTAGGPTVAIQYAQPLGDCAIEHCADACTP